MSNPRNFVHAPDRSHLSGFKRNRSSAPILRHRKQHTFTVGAGATNLSLVVSNKRTAYSYLLLKKGGTPTDTVFDFALA